MSDVRRNVEAVFGLSSDRPRTSLAAERASDVELSDAKESVRGDPRPFSVFRHSDALRAAELAGQLGSIADEAGPADAVGAASAAAADVARSDPGLARHALGLFATHHPWGRRTPIPSLLRRTAVAAASSADDAELTLGSRSTGREVALDWFREDPLANEHHEHWHWVYPNQPPPPKPVKERHGELFYYMHQQMLARYDAERVALGLSPVSPLEDFNADVGEGYDPGLLVTTLDYESRDAGETMVDQPDYDRAMLSELTRRLKDAAANRRLGSGANSLALDGHQGSDLLGHEAEPTTASRFPNFYGWHHGMGHMLISAASDRDLGVMSDPAAAIRDPVFWRWHKHVDDLHFAYQDSLAPHLFDDHPPISIDQLWVEPEGPTGESPATGKEIELRTMMRTGNYALLNGQRYRFDYLSHEPFQVSVSLENRTEQPVPVTLRLFLLPHDLFDPASDPSQGAARQMRRFAIEIDKAKLEAQPGLLTFVRAGRDMSVIRRPAVVDPADVADVDGGNSDEGSQECTCGWPFGLLLPRGTSDGMSFSLFAMLTDNRLDRVGSPKPCGSMSFCGVGDDYPDARPMGYPFDRPLSQSVEALVAISEVMALRPLTIRWTNAPQD